MVFICKVSGFVLKHINILLAVLKVPSPSFDLYVSTVLQNILKQFVTINNGIHSTILLCFKIKDTLVHQLYCWWCYVTTSKIPSPAAKLHFLYYLVHYYHMFYTYWSTWTALRFHKTDCKVTILSIHSPTYDKFIFTVLWNRIHQFETKH